MYAKRKVMKTPCLLYTLEFHFCYELVIVFMTPYIRVSVVMLVQSLWLSPFFFSIDLNQVPKLKLVVLLLIFCPFYSHLFLIRFHILN